MHVYALPKEFVLYFILITKPKYIKDKEECNNNLSFIFDPFTQIKKYINKRKEEKDFTK